MFQQLGEKMGGPS